MAVVLLALPVALVGLVLALCVGSSSTVGVNEHSGVVEIARHTRRWRVVGLLLGAVAAVLLLALGQRVDALGRVTALAPTVLGAGVLLGTIAGELTARPSVGIRRSAAVETRTLGAILPRGRAVAARRLDRPCSSGRSPSARRGVRPTTWGAPGACSAALHRGRPRGRGRSLVGSSRGPVARIVLRPAPLACALLVLAVLVALALRAIVTGPRPDLDSRGLDTMLRRWSVGNVLTAATVTVLGTLGPVAVLMASALGGMRLSEQHRPDPAWPGSLRSSGRWPPAPRSACWPGWCSRPTIRVDDLPRAAARRGGPGRGAGAMTLSTVTVDVLDPTPPYEQLRRQLADLIGSGVLSPGDRLPPVRQLAADLGLAVGTVARTYRELEQAGYVRSRRGGGTRVAPTRARPADPRAGPGGGRLGLPRPRPRAGGIGRGGPRSGPPGRPRT